MQVPEPPKFHVGMKMRLWVADSNTGEMLTHDPIAVVNKIVGNEIEFVDSEGEWLCTATLEDDELVIDKGR